MFKELEDLAVLLGLSQGQILAIAREIAGTELRTTDLLSREERAVLIAELESMLQLV